MDFGLGAPLIAQSESIVFGKVLRDRALWIFDIAKDACTNRADRHTSRGGGWVDPWHHALGQAAIDAMDAEGTFLNHPARPALDLWRSPLGGIRIWFIRDTPIKAANVIRAGYLAVATANAAIVIHNHQAIVTHPGRSYRANPRAGRFLAVLAGSVHIEIDAQLGALGEDDIPLHFIVWDIVYRLASLYTIIAANATI